MHIRAVVVGLVHSAAEVRHDVPGSASHDDQQGGRKQHQQ